MCSSDLLPSKNSPRLKSSPPSNPPASQLTPTPRITYTDPHSTLRTWESATRLTRPAGSLIDGVGIVAILQNGPSSNPSSTSSTASGPSILLQKQFRPPVNAVCIEIPAGLIDAGETAEQCALRELKEETGYVGRVEEGLGISPVMFNGE